MVAPKHPQERRRLTTLQSLRILDTATEDAFDRLTRLASHICETPISLVSLVDAERQWFKSRVGLGATETHRDLAFCAHAILDEGLFVIEDATKDERFRGNALVTSDPNIRFYAGAPIRHAELPMGTLCVIDRVPRTLSDRQRASLEDLAVQVEHLLALRHSTAELLRRNRDLIDFTGVLAHDLRSPVGNICSLAEILVEDYGDRDGELGELAGLIANRASRLSTLMTELFSFWQLEKRQQIQENVDLAAVVQSVIEMQPGDREVRWSVSSLPTLIGATIELKQIMMNLLGNAVKYCEESTAIIDISARRQGAFWRVDVADNGPGVPTEWQDKIFDPLQKAHQRHDIESTGLGLAIVKRLVVERGGAVGVDSDGTSGSSFWFTWPT